MGPEGDPELPDLDNDLHVADLAPVLKLLVEDGLGDLPGHTEPGAQHAVVELQARETSSAMAPRMAQTISQATRT
jgi:hypothetical protein